jgi:hypothetical protein
MQHPPDDSKYFGFPAPAPQNFQVLSILGLAGAIETIGGLMLALGLYTRWAALIMSGEMWARWQSPFSLSDNVCRSVSSRYGAAASWKRFTASFSLHSSSSVVARGASIDCAGVPPTLLRQLHQPLSAGPQIPRQRAHLFHFGRP